MLVVPECRERARFYTALRMTEHRQMHKIPSYRVRNGYDQALVTLTDSETKKRRDYWLGPANSPESRERYHILIAAWEANRRRFPDPTNPTSPIRIHDIQAKQLSADGSEDGTGTVVQLLRAYWTWAKGYYQPKECCALKVALRLMKQYYGSTPVVEFGPLKLRVLRDAMINGDPKANRKPWTRKFINQQCRRIRHVFKWAAAHELAHVEIFQALGTVEPLRRGRTTAREGAKVLPVNVKYVESIRPYVSRQVAALIDLQLLTGARSGELLKIRALDIDTSDPEVWVYAPQEHKTASLGKTRQIFFGPGAQEVLRPFMMGRPIGDYLFSPAEAEEERRAAVHAKRKTPLSCGNKPGSNISDTPVHQAGSHYTNGTYARAIERGCDLAFPPPPPLCPLMGANGKKETAAAFQARLTPQQRAELYKWRRAHRWHPHQLRHTAATEIRRKYGLEEAQLLLGHSSAQITDAVYAERDTAKLRAIAKDAS